jgi:hypothetical protein
MEDPYSRQVNGVGFTSRQLLTAASGEVASNRPEGPKQPGS